MNHQYNSKFLIRPRPFQKEYIVSYLERLRIENGYFSIDNICKTVFDTRLSIINLVKGNFDKNKFSKYTDLKIQEISELCLNDEIHYISSHINVCLLCFKEESYIKKEWYLKDYICEKHLLPLVNRCLSCNMLYKISIISSGVCVKCKTSIFSSINFRLKNEISFHNTLNFLKNILNYKYYKVNSLFYNVRNFSQKYNQAHNIIINRNNSFELLLVSYFFNENIYCRQASNFLIDYIYFLINMNNFIKESDLDPYINNISDIVDKFTIKNIDNSFFDTINLDLFSSYYIKMDNSNNKKYYFLSFYNIENLLGINKYLILNLCKVNILKSYKGIYVDIIKVFELCINIKLSSTYNDINEDFVYFKDLKVKDKIRVLRNLESGGFILYNFNPVDVFLSIKISLNDLNYKA